MDGAAGPGQTDLVMEQLQRLGLFTDGGGNPNPGQLQGLMAMLSKQGEQTYARVLLAAAVSSNLRLAACMWSNVCWACHGL